MNRYVKLPEMWILVLTSRNATGADWRVAVNLLQKAKFSRAFKYANGTVAKLKISRRTKNRSLDRLATWGLISTHDRLGKSPVVTVLYQAPGQPRDGL